MVRFYSDKLNQFFETAEACAEAEEAHDKAIAEAEVKKKALAEARAERAKEIDRLYEEMIKAQKAHAKAVNDFVKDYGSYHKTYRSFEDWPFDFPRSFRDLFGV